MRRILLLFLYFFIFISVIFSQTIIENPEKPLSKNAGRVLKLKEVMRIVDTGEEFYFKMPWGIDAGADGSIFVKDGVRLFKFDANGKFERNIVRVGQGPGEITTEIENFIVMGNEVIILCTSLNKLIKTDLEGKLIKELIFGEKRPSKLIAYYNNKYFYVDFIRKSFERKEGFRDYNRNLYVFDKEGNITPTPYSFPVKRYVSYRAFGKRVATSSSKVTRLQTSKLCQRYLYLSHTQDYLIKQFDLEELQIRKSFRRAYPRVKFKADKLRPFKYYNDVHRLLAYRNNLWVLTSTFDRKKGILVDVFNEDGKYLDNIYLPLLNSKTGDEFSQLYFPMTIHGGFLYSVEHDNDWNFYVAKYEIID